MFIYVDESGSFVCTDRRESWNCIAAYVTAERNRRKLEAALTGLKRSVGIPPREEIKGRQRSSETAYFEFLSELGAVDGVLFAVLVDMGDHEAASVAEHREAQSRLIAANVGKMERSAGRRALQRLAARVSRLPVQLYVQLQCQIVLIEQIVRYATLYYAQRQPQTLGKFRWRIDQKDETRTAYEFAFSDLAPMLLQTRGLSRPLLTLEGADYRKFDRFLNEGPPGYLREVYGLEPSGRPGINIGLVCREDREFVDSRRSLGVQVADLLASGLRRCLRRGFVDNERAARLLGGLMTEREAERGVLKRLPPFVLHLSPDGGYLSEETHSLLVDTMAPAVRGLVTP